MHALVLHAVLSGEGINWQQAQQLLPSKNMMCKEVDKLNL
jgi:hypothetical protein